MKSTVLLSLLMSVFAFWAVGCAPGEGGFGNGAGTGALAAPVLTGPADEATVQNTSVTLNWQAVTGADNYRVEVVKIAGLTRTPIDGSPATAVNTNLGVSGLEDGSIYEWRVTALSTNIQAPGTSAWFRFTTAAKPNPPNPKPVLIPEADG